LNRFSARLPSLAQAPVITPFQMYVELRELLGELAALHPDRDEFESSAYHHEDQFLCFRELANKIRSFLRGAVAPSFLKLPFKDVGGLLTAHFSEEHFGQPNAYYLGIKTRLDPRVLAAYVETPDSPTTPDKFKLMPLSLATRAIRGIVLKEQRHVPLELPAATDLHYFSLDRTASTRMWQQIQSEKAAVVRWTGSELDWSDASFTLYMTVPAGASKL